MVLLKLFHFLQIPFLIFQLLFLFFHLFRNYIFYHYLLLHLLILVDGDCRPERRRAEQPAHCQDRGWGCI